MVDLPTFDFWMMTYTAVGAAVIWGKLGREKRKVYVLSDLLDGLIPQSASFRIVLEFVIFIVLGCLISAGVVHPTNAAQAIAAGMGWTGMLSTKQSTGSARAA
jgi:hypothetical protein